MYGQKSYTFYVNIGPDELMRFYRGAVHRLRVKCYEGLVIDLDVNHLRPYTTRSGIKGEFRLLTSSQNKFIKIEKIG